MTFENALRVTGFCTHIISFVLEPLRIDLCCLSDALNFSSMFVSLTYRTNNVFIDLKQIFNWCY